SGITVTRAMLAIRRWSAETPWTGDGRLDSCADPRDSTALSGAFRPCRTHRGTECFADPGRPQPAVRQCRHGPVRAVLPRSADPALRDRDQRPEVRAHRRYRECR